MSNKPSLFIILCEDKLQDSAIRRFLKKGWNIKERQIRNPGYPKDGRGGSGEKHVRDKYASELRAYRTRQASTVLVVVIDADTKSVQDHHNELDTAARGNSIPARSNNESVIHVIPKHHIETWLAFLDGDENIDETISYKSGYEFKNCESDARNLIDKLADNCKQNNVLENPPDSLMRTCLEFNQRIRLLLIT